MGCRGSITGRAWLSATVLIAVAIVGWLSPPPASATFPGPNGQIAFADGRNGGIAAINPAGTDRHDVTHRRGDDLPSYSPDGTKLAFVCRYHHNTRVCTVNADGSHRRRLLGPHLWGVDPTFSPSGKRIVFAGGRPHRYSNIWVMRADGTHRHVLMRTCGNDWGPSFSPDGKRIAFERVHCDSDDISVAVVDADGSGLHELTTDPKDDFSGWPDFAPDGRQIVYARWRNFKLGIWVMNADGSNEHELTPRWTRLSFAPVFSPDGRKIAFNNRAQTHAGIYLMDADGENIHRLRNSSPKDAVSSWGVAAPVTRAKSSGLFSPQSGSDHATEPTCQLSLRKFLRRYREAVSSQAYTSRSACL